MSDINYSEDLAIDPHKLDEEWLYQSQLYMKYSQLASNAQKERDKAKENLDVVRAGKDRDIREKPDEYSLIKVTEAVVSATILQTKEYQEANNKLIEANYKLNLYQSGVRALEHKKKALENLVQLWIANYYSGPTEPREISKGKKYIMIRDNEDLEKRKELNRKRRK